MAPVYLPITSSQVVQQQLAKLILITSLNINFKLLLFKRSNDKVLLKFWYKYTASCKKQFHKKIKYLNLLLLFPAQYYSSDIMSVHHYTYQVASESRPASWSA